MTLQAERIESYGHQDVTEEPALDEVYRKTEPAKTSAPDSAPARSTPPVNAQLDIEDVAGSLETREPTWSKQPGSTSGKAGRDMTTTAIPSPSQIARTVQDYPRWKDALADVSAPDYNVAPSVATFYPDGEGRFNGLAYVTVHERKALPSRSGTYVASRTVKALVSGHIEGGAVVIDELKLDPSEVNG